MVSHIIGCIYLAVNKANGSIYVGKSLAGIRKRMKSHIRGARSGNPQPFPCAIRKYGEGGFYWSELYLSNDHDALMEAEIELIATYKAAGFRMYNATAGGDGASRKRPEAEIARMRLKVITDKHKEQLRNSWTPERRAAQAEKMQNRIVSDAARQALSDARKGMTFSAEHRENIRRSKLGNTCRLGTGKR